MRVHFGVLLNYCHVVFAHCRWLYGFVAVLFLCCFGIVMQGVLKIADFGLAREFGSPLKVMTQMVVTLWFVSLTAARVLGQFPCEPLFILSIHAHTPSLLHSPSLTHALWQVPSTRITAR